MKKYFIYIISLVFLYTSCSQEGGDVNNSLPKEKFIKVLKDIHLADGIITAGGLNKKVGKKDTVSLYNYIFKKHQVSKISFENSVSHYCENPEEFKSIYKTVIYELKQQKKKSDKKTDKKAKKNKNDIWKKKREWSLPDDGKKTTIPFKIKSKKYGVYTLSAKYLIYPDDKAVQPRMSIYIKYKDGTSDFKEYGTFVANGKKKLHKIFITSNPKKEVKLISGWLYKHSKGSGNKHVEITDIQLIHKPLKKSKKKKKTVKKVK